MNYNESDLDAGAQSFDREIKSIDEQRDGLAEPVNRTFNGFEIQEQEYFNRVILQQKKKW
jgi:hypothetical protein